MKRIFSIIALLTLLIAATAALTSAQDDTTDELAFSASTDIGELSICHPEDWSALRDPEGNILVVDFDIELPQEDWPEAPRIIRLFIGSLPLENEDLTASELLVEVFELDSTQIEEIEQPDESTLARFDTSQEDTSAYLYGTYLTDNVFAIGNILGPLALISEQISQLEEVFTCSEISFTDFIPEDALTEIAAYDGITQSFTEQGFPQIGSADAPVEITEISSFACPACGQFHSVVWPGLLDRIAAGEVRLTYVPMYSTGSVPNGRYAAEAALCAADQGAFWPFHDALYNAQVFQSLAFLPERISQGAEILELDMEAYQDCLDSDEKLSIIDDAEVFGREMPGFTGTPTIVINGEKLEDWSPDRLNAAIDAAIADGGD